MENIFEFTESSIFGVKVTENDLDVIADTLRTACKNESDIRGKNIYSYLKIHWDNLFTCIEVASSKDEFFLMTRNEVYNIAKEMHPFKITEIYEKGAFLNNWAKVIEYEIKEGRLTHFSKFLDLRIEKGSLRSKFKGIKYKINRRKIQTYLEKNQRRIRDFNFKAHKCLLDFVKWSFGFTNVRPWLSPLIIGVLIILLLFTIGMVVFEMSFGITVILYEIVHKICILCFIGYSLPDIVKKAGELI